MPPSSRSTTGPARYRDEVAAVAAALDTMASTLQRKLLGEQRFTADVAHELRTPLTGLHAAAELLPAGRPTELVRNRVAALRTLTEDLLEISRLDAGSERLELDVPRALVAELDLERLIALAQPVKYRPISRFPATSQDLAVVVGLDVPTDRVVAAIRKYAGADLESIELFDVYEGPQVGAGKRSLAYRLTFRSASRTLSDADVNKVRVKIVRGLERDVGAMIRG